MVTPYRDILDKVRLAISRRRGRWPAGGLWAKKGFQWDDRKGTRGCIHV